MSILIPGLICCQDSFAQVAPAGGSIKGIVADSASGKTLDFITINLMKDKTTAVKADFSKGDGSFVFANLKPMKYMVVLVGVGYKSRSIDVDLTDSTRRHVGIRSSIGRRCDERGDVHRVGQGAPPHAAAAARFSGQ